MIKASRILKFSLTLYKECKSKHILTLASSSSFFLLITFVPFTLLIVKALGFVIGGQEDQYHLILNYVKQLVPSNLKGVVDIFSKVLQKALFAKGSHTIINFSFLFLSTLGFVNSIWRALGLITGEKEINSLMKVVKGIGIVGLAFIFFLVMFFMPVIIELLQHIVELGFVVNTLAFLNLDKVLSVQNISVYTMDFLSFALIVGFFTSLFKYILHPRVKTKSALVGAFVFSTLMIILKTSFYLYVDLTKSGLVQNYGASYSIVLMFVWILSSMAIFYFSVIFTLTYCTFFHSSTTQKLGEERIQEGNLE